MLAGELYDAGAPELQMELAATHRWLVRYNAALDASAADRRELLLERLAAVGEGAVIRPPFHCDYGFNIRLGAGIFLNFNCVILDVVEVSIGDKDANRARSANTCGRSSAGPGAAGCGPGVRPSRSHRMQCVDRRRRHHPAGGVSIGDDALIGAGSVVTRDIPAGAVAFGNPARVQTVSRAL